MRRIGPSLSKILEHAGKLSQVKKTDLHFGDLVIVNTHNSKYKIRVVGKDLYQVSGGWFESNGVSPLKTSITGCTWGGSIIKMDIVAACGLCMEFGNRVVTSAICNIVVIPFNSRN